MPTYLHICNACNQEFEDIYSIHAAVPTVCPNCNVEGQVKRLISCNVSANVELTGRELVQKLWKEGKDLARQARTDEKLARTLYGSK
ncbi:zinc ribbon domain-containing protein [Candidatus Pacearchaeota archaeon]|jgi:putative FmdB family regulatory protein|nr:zinc ribbon domain-containing protein [Candidatus Pacearchaeota archaeon]